MSGSRRFESGALSPNNAADAKPQIAPRGQSIGSSGLIHAPPIAHIASTAGTTIMLSSVDVISPILALVLLIAATVLAVYKPFGMTAHGLRKEGERRQTPQLVPAQMQARIKHAPRHLVGEIGRDR